jgi:tRNA G10  N-methylase Trm11
LPEIYRADMMHSKFSECLKFDAIVCDPPYGIRAGSRITGSNYDELNQKLVQE